MTVRIGTRGSALARAQAASVAARLGDAELVIIASEGDTSPESLAELGGTGVFAGALRESLRALEVDVVVHSLKDLPVDPADGLEVAAIPKRADARDALCARDGLTLAELPEGARVGTGSPRRRAQLGARRPDLEVVDIRGNVDTRLARVGADDPERRLDAVVLAAAGLERLDRLAAATELLGIDGWPTAPGQGALAVEIRRDADPGIRRAVAKLENRPARLTATAERGVLARLEAGCAAPIGAHAILDGGLLFLAARVYRPDGSAQLSAAHALYPEDVADPAAELAERVAGELLDGGAAELAPSLGAAR